MADVARAKSKLTIASSLIPERAEPGTIFIAKNDSTVWYATAREGLVVCLSDVLNCEPPRCVPVNGRNGIDGLMGPRGERGETGKDGKDGTNGKDGRDGSRGDQGFQGAPGECKCRCKTEIAETRLSKVSDENVALRADLETTRAQFAELKTTVQALLDADKKGRQYVEWLKARANARKES